MAEKVGRNDPCPCGSGKKYKQCCQKLPGVRKKIKAKVLSGGAKKETQRGPVLPDLLERTFGDVIAASKEEEAPPKLEEQSSSTEEAKKEENEKQS
ncbi:MAG: SEC-C metal-binding domain-containing protein [Chlamydiota bacterium]